MIEKYLYESNDWGGVVGMMWMYGFIGCCKKKFMGVIAANSFRRIYSPIYGQI